MRNHSAVFFLPLMLLVLGVAVSAQAETLYLYQRGYVAGGEGASTTLTDAAVAAFLEDHPGVDIRVIGLPWSREGDLKLRAVLLNRRKVDVFRLAHDELSGFIPSRGTLLSPIDPHLTDADRADISSGALDALRYNGNVMAWPLWSTAIPLLANAEILRERGIEPHAPGKPWTWNEFLNVLKGTTFTRNDGTQVFGFTAAARPPLFEWSPLLFAHAGPLFPDSSESEPGDLELPPGLESALTAVAELKTLGVVPASFGTDDQNAAQTQFLDGRAAFITSTPGFIRALAANDFPHVILQPPVGAWGEPITTGALGCFAVVHHPGDPDRVAAAHALAKYLTSAEIAEDVPGWYLAPPVRQSVESFAADPAYAGLMDVVRTSVYMTPPGGPGFVGATLIPKFQAALIGAQSPANALADIQAAYRRSALR